MKNTEVIIPVFNGEKHLSDLLESLSLQTSNEHLVILADNGSTDASVEIAKSYENIINLRIINASRRQGKAYAINCAVQQSNAQGLIFIDQDDLVNTSYVESMSKALELNPAVAAMMDADYLSDGVEIKPRDIPHDQRLGAFTIKTVAGGTIAVTRDAYDHIGGFNENFNYSTNDVEFCWRAYSKGYDFQLVHDAILFYRLRETIKDNFQQGVEYGIGNYHIAQLHPEIRGDQASYVQLLLDTTSLLADFLMNRSRRARTAHLIGKNLGQAREKLLNGVS